jgi:dnd system-associated protein 4
MSDLLENLTGEEGIFPSFRECLVFAAALGYKHGLRKPFEQTDEPIPWNVFEQYEPLLHLLAIASTDDGGVIAQERFGEQLTILEEFANGGLSVMQSAIERDGGSHIDALARLVKEAILSQSNPQSGPNLDSILATVLGSKGGGTD